MLCNIYGIIGDELRWITDYLNDRSQVVTCNGQTSERLYTKFGVSQGSTLGPFLFLIFINDLSQAVSGGYCSIFADDVSIYTGKNVLYW